MRKPKTYVLDTSVLLYDPDLMYKLGEATVVIPTAVIKELDGLKRNKNGNIAGAARKVANTLDRLGSYSDIASGARLSTGQILKVSADYEAIDDLASDADNRIIGAGIKLKKETGGNVTVLTTDTNMRTVARSHGLKGEFYPFGDDYEKALSIVDNIEPRVILTRKTTFDDHFDEEDFVPGMKNKITRDTFSHRRYFPLICLVATCISLLLDIRIFFVIAGLIAILMLSHLLRGRNIRGYSKNHDKFTFVDNDYHDPRVLYVQKF